MFSGNVHRRDARTHETRDCNCTKGITSSLFASKAHHENPQTPFLPLDCLRSFATETTSKLDILGLDGDTLGVDGAQVGIFKEGDEVGLNGLLKSTNGG